MHALEPGMGGKWVELLEEIAPNVNRVAVIVHPDEPKSSLAGFLSAIELPARSFGVQLTILPDTPKASRSYSDSITELERTIDGFARTPNGALIVFPGTYTTTIYYRQIPWLAERYRLPAVYPFKPCPCELCRHCAVVDDVRESITEEQRRLNKSPIAECRQGAKEREIQRQQQRDRYRIAPGPHVVIHPERQQHAAGNPDQPANHPKSRHIQALEELPEQRMATISSWRIGHLFGFGLPR